METAATALIMVLFILAFAGFVTMVGRVPRRPGPVHVGPTILSASARRAR